MREPTRSGPGPAGQLRRIAAGGLLLLEIVQGAGELDIGYELDLTFKPRTAGRPARVEGVNRIRIRNNWDAPLGEVYLHNSANAARNPGHPAPSGTVIGKVRCSHLGRVADTNRITMRVGLFPAVTPGEQTLLEIPFTTWLSENPSPFLPTTGNRGDTTIHNLMFFYPVLEYFYHDGWHPQTHHGRADPYSNFAAYEVAVTVPAGYRVGASAHLTGTDTLSAGQVRYRYTYPLAISFSMVISDRLLSRHSRVNSVEVELLYTPGEAIRAEPVLKKLEQLLPFYEQRFGPCPNDKLTVTMGYSLAAAAVASTNYIIFQGRLRTDDQVLPHELAHQWFGNSINVDANFETWLSESFAEYAAWLFRQSRADTTRRTLFRRGDLVAAIWKDFENLSPEDLLRRLHDLLGERLVPPVYQPGKQTNWENQAQVYSRYIVGNHALQMLQMAVGDSLMQRIIYTYATENVWKTVNTETFIGTVERLAGRPLADNFRLALTTNLRPDVRIEGVQITGRSDRRWDNRIQTGFEGEWLLPVDMEVVTRSRDTLNLERLNLQQSGEIHLVTDSPVRSVVLDPHQRLFDANRFNNRWPRRFLWQPIYGLPNWEFYKVYYRPLAKRDWRRQWRLGLVISGGLGINLMPLFPAFFQNAFELELSYAPTHDTQPWGGRITYRTPLQSVDLTYWEFRSGYEYPRNIQSLSLVRYFGRMQYLPAHGRSAYQRWTAELRRTEFTAPAPGREWQPGRLLLLQGGVDRFRYSPQRRSNLQLAALAGRSLARRPRLFYRTSAMLDLEEHLWKRLIVRAHGEGGLVWDERASNYLRYRLAYLPRIWKERDDFVPLFRGVTSQSEQTWDTAVGFGFSLGAAASNLVWPMLYADGALVAAGNDPLSQRWKALQGSPVLWSAGLGLESQTLLEVGLYFPLWVSDPPGSEKEWALRWLVQWGYYF